MAKIEIRRLIPYVIFFVIVLLLFGLGRRLWAQSGGPYDLSWSTIDGGGQTAMTGGGYILGGTIGQPDSGRLIGDGYQLEAGFWHCFPAIEGCVTASPTPTPTVNPTVTPTPGLTITPTPTATPTVTTFDVYLPMINADFCIFTLCQ